MSQDTGLLDGAHHRQCGALRGKAIFRQGDVAGAVYRVDHGCVRLQVEDASGVRQIIAFVFPGQTFCAGLETHWASAHAVVDTVLTRFPHSALWDLIAKDSRAAMSLLFSADELLTEVAHHLGRLSHSSAYERLTWFVAWVAGHTSRAEDQLLDLPMSRQEVADFLGIAPETVSRLFRRMESRGKLLRVSPRQYRYCPDAPRHLPSSNAAAQAAAEIVAA